MEHQIAVQDFENILEAWLDDNRQRGVGSFLALDGSWQSDLVELVRSQDAGWLPLTGLPQDDKHEAHMRAPLLVDLSLRPDVIPIWLRDGVDKRLGLAIFSTLDIAALRISLKRFQSVMLPDNDQPVFFRYFDGRTFDCFMRTGFPEQWADFFDGIEGIAAITDVSVGWTNYVFSNGSLQIGVLNTTNWVTEWHTLPYEPPEDDTYRIADPFRTIGAHQYARLMDCCRQAFRIEITNFILNAFPDMPDCQNPDAVLAFVAENEKQSIALGHENEDAVFLWCVCAFLFGPLFFEDDELAPFMRNTNIEIVARLEQLLEAANADLDNAKLLDLIDTQETYLEYEDGTKIAFRNRSGKPIPTS
ncbi:DUF4123 domain-containing protein [Nereida sp. MMG025]|uniref:DUF4123 domain-containing protein n=1 Tax=Nereida sp. MMG025 TaxID=2909981 RepID=UPI001F1E7012|nr:DUF4123 domain-containing protein [Nereida sp. MMG025]MCF6446112.1 DUF4123 domain-containing protein [Nereida sp. MMG025]